MKKYTISEIINIILNLEIFININDLFDKKGNHITKKKYGKILIRNLCKKLKELDNDNT